MSRNVWQTHVRGSYRLTPFPICWVEWEKGMEREARAGRVESKREKKGKRERGRGRKGRERKKGGMEEKEKGGRVR